ncbi:MAG TPA: 2-deoxy-D-gluconate 3-dehydrogenase [Mycobacterium sp.]|nr:2-deoxy-D-gluconate 3-dehydrogenase [Mycobacterium sp.]
MTFDAFADFRMDGHVAIVTGGAQNIGEAIARIFAGAGARVVIADRNGDKAAETAATIAAETGADVSGMACDVTQDADVARVVERTVVTFGGISTLVNNVGWGRRCEDPLDIGVEDMVEEYKINCVAALRMTAACRPYLLEADNATVTNSGSMVAVTPAFEFLAYSAAKAALNHAMLSVAHYFGKQVRVNSILIGTVLTDAYADVGLDESVRHALANPKNLTGRAGTPQDVANAFLWLASPAAGWVSGQTIQVAGGGARSRILPR